jgi:hypothetical protein
MGKNTDDTDAPTVSDHDKLLDKMEATNRRWKAEAADGDDDDDDRLLQEAIDLAIQQGRGWAPGEKEEYMKRILDDDFIPPIFCSTEEELQRTGLAEAFAALQYDDDPAIVMAECKKKGTDAFLDGKRNQASNVQYYRDAINHYYEAIAWAKKIEPIEHMEQRKKQQQKVMGPPPPPNNNRPPVEFQHFKEKELDEIRSTLYSNAALAHLQLKNWGFVRDDGRKAVTFNPHNVKAWFRLAKAYQMLQAWEEAGDAIDSGLACPNESQNTDLLKLQRILGEKVRKARLLRQKRERTRAERVSKVKEVWKHCKEGGMQLGRVALVASVTDDDEEGGGEADESRWHHHFPHTGVIPSSSPSSSVAAAAAAPGGDRRWSWPCLFVYPSHSQSDFILQFGEDEMLAMRMAEMFPEVDFDDEKGETAVQWDYNNEFQCSELAVYFEVNCPEDNNNHNTTKNNMDPKRSGLVHPDSVERLLDLGATMQFYESSRALKGDEGPEMVNLVQAVERKRLHKQRKAWKKEHGSLWAKPDPCPVVRVHPAMTLRDILVDKRMVVANFLVTLVVIPENHPAHADYLKEHKCIGVLQPNDA